MNTFKAGAISSHPTHPALLGAFNTGEAVIGHGLHGWAIWAWVNQRLGCWNDGRFGPRLAYNLSIESALVARFLPPSTLQSFHSVRRPTDAPNPHGAIAPQCPCKLCKRLFELDGHSYGLGGFDRFKVCHGVSGKPYAVSFASITTDCGAERIKA